MQIYHRMVNNIWHHSYHQFSKIQKYLCSCLIQIFFSDVLLLGLQLFFLFIGEFIFSYPGFYYQLGKTCSVFTNSSWKLYSSYFHPYMSLYEYEKMCYIKSFAFLQSMFFGTSSSLTFGQLRDKLYGPLGLWLGRSFSRDSDLKPHLFIQESLTFFFF